MAEVSIILPAHNEGSTLRQNVLRLERVLSGILDDFEIIISEDGSTDGTADIAKSMRSGRIRVFNNGKRLGKGAAIGHAAGFAGGDIIIFMDADLASEPAHVKELVRLMKDGNALVVGSRYLRESKARRNPIRYFASKSFNWLVRVLLGSKISDHQCGFKAFRKDLVLPVVREIEDSRWFWDTELLVRAQRRGLRIAEVPIEWREVPGSRFRLVTDTLNMAGSLIRFKLRHG